MKRVLIVGVPIAMSVALFGGAFLMNDPAPATAEDAPVAAEAPPVVATPETPTPDAEVAPPTMRSRPRAQLRPVDAPAPPVEEEDEDPAAVEQSIFTEKVAAVAKEPRDASWAPAQERALQEHYGALEASLPVRLSSVECRTDNCLLSFDFENYADAQAAVERIAHAAFAEPYGFDVMFPAPGDPEAPYTGRMLTNRPRRDG